MTAEQRKEKLDSLADRLFGLSKELEMLIPEFSGEVDQKAGRSIVTDLHWAVENCTVIGLHQIGEALDDKT
jgi:hypothetical protein